MQSRFSMKGCGNGSQSEDWNNQPTRSVHFGERQVFLPLLQLWVKKQCVQDSLALDGNQFNRKKDYSVFRTTEKKKPLSITHGNLQIRKR